MKAGHGNIMKKIALVNTLGRNAKILKTTQKLWICGPLALCNKLHGGLPLQYRRDFMYKIWPVVEASILNEWQLVCEGVSELSQCTNLSMVHTINLPFVVSSVPFLYTCAWISSNR